MTRGRFGGARDRRGTVRGVFSIQRIDGRYRFVKPDGGLFIAVGFNHIDRRKTARGHDPHHLVFGAIFDGNREIPRLVLEAASKHVDAVAVRCYGYFKDQAERLEWIHATSGKPILLADPCFAVATGRRIVESVRHTSRGYCATTDSANVRILRRACTGETTRAVPP